MSISRRQVVVQGAVVGAGFLAAGVPGWDAFALAADIPKRVSFASLTWDSDLVKIYIHAVGMLDDKNRAADDPFKWENLARIHNDFCPHGNWYFLPWHRAYTTMYERIIRAVTKYEGFAIPYWDWTENPKMPEFFTAKTIPKSNARNPLYVEQRRWPAQDPMRPEWVGEGVYAEIMAAQDFELFGTSRPRGQVDTNPGWIRRPTGDESTLEATPHNNVHNAIGGWMPTSYSPRDPIFLAHHSNIDRIWAQWIKNGRMNSPSSLWTTMPFTDNFINPDKTRWSPRVSQLTDVMALGYSYDLKAETSLVAARMAPLGEKLTAYFAHPGAKTAGVERFVAANKSKAVANPGSSLSLSVAVGSHRLGLAAHPPRGEGAGRVYAFLRDVEASDPETTEFRVFVGAEPLKSHDTSDPRFVGLFGIFAAMGHHMRPSFTLDLTEAVARVYGGAGTPPKDFTIQLVPVPSKANGKAGTVTYDTLEIVFVSA